MDVYEQLQWRRGKRTDRLADQSDFQNVEPPLLGMRYGQFEAMTLPWKHVEEKRCPAAEGQRLTVLEPLPFESHAIPIALSA